MAKLHPGQWAWVSALTVMFSLLVAIMAAVTPGQAQGQFPTLPPTWTPAGTWTPAPLSPEVTSDGGIPTITPAPTIKPVAIEGAQLFAPLFYLSKHGSTTVYLARVDPYTTASTQVTNTSDNVTAFDISSSGQIAYGTDKGLVAAAGHKTPWQAKTAGSDPLSPVEIAWSPDGKTLAFTMRASKKDFAALARNEPSGVYLWTSTGQPIQFLADRNTGTDYYQYTIDSWSPDGTQLLLYFTDLQVASNTQSFGWITITLAAKTSRSVVRYAPGDQVRYQDAIWLPDGSAVMVFNPETNDPKAPGGAVVIVPDPNGGKQHPVTINSTTGSAPQVVSHFAFLPDGKLLALGSSGRDQPLQLYLGAFDSPSFTATIEPIAEAFKLKWPGVLLLSREGFPAYVLDDQYGVVTFEDQHIFSFYPSQLGMSATDSAVYDSSLWPAWEFAPAKATISLP